MRPSITLQSPAKLNLALSVGPPREVDGLHPICSWMTTIDLHDELVVTRLENDRFSRYAILWHADAKRRTDIDWPITRDLAVRAHLALESHVGDRLPVQMKLEKRIPVGGGLGGGSSNAAAMLRAVNELFALGLSRETLASIAAALGSDVPFFLSGGSAIVEGTGESIEIHEAMPDLHAVVVFPPFACPTGLVYRAYDDLGPVALDAGRVRALAGERPVRAAALFNDLAAPAARIAPDLSRVLRDVGDLAERPAHVTGSGSTVFVVCDDALHAAALARAIESRWSMPAIAVRAV
jgi:4-diphosphocytidyl-2-C-methyl-D-erythritol kinase